MSNLNVTEMVQETIVINNDPSIEIIPSIDSKLFPKKVEEKDEEKEEETEKDSDKESDNDSEKESSNKGIVGLNNQGNTCYLNSVIQILSNLDHFRNYLFEGNFVGSLKPELDDSLFYQTYRIIKHLWETTSDDLTPKSFRKKFIEKENQFMGFNQQDSHEAMQFLIDNLHEEIAQPIDINVSLPTELNEFFDMCDKYYSDENKDKDKSILKIIDDNRDKALDYFAMKYYSTISKKYSEIYELFHSITCDLIKCPNCNHLKYKFDNGSIISLGFPELNDDLIKDSEQFKKFYNERVEEFKDKVTDTELITKFCLNELKNKYIYKLSDLLDNYQKAEELDENNAWECSNCEKKVRALKQTKIYKHSKYLVFHFKRFKQIVVKGNVEIFKVKNLVGYEEIINIRHMMIKNSDSTNYKLVGGINHIGAYEFGHFTNFSKNNGKWYNYNDSRVNEINCTGIPISPNAYMLIYERIEDSEIVNVPASVPVPTSGPSVVDTSMD
jgi:ubiquitin C-terminal hydrolase